MNNEYLRAYRERTSNLATKKYEKTKNGFLMRAYRNMKSRVTGIQSKKFHLYIGLELLDKLDFYVWSLSQPEFHELFDSWEKSGYDRHISPSVDRIDSKRGYTIGNIRWITHSENSRLGALNRAA